MTDEMEGKARKMSVTSSEGRSSICIVGGPLEGNLGSFRASVCYNKRCESV